MKKLISFIFLLFVCCGNGISNDVIIAEKSKCEKAGMSYIIYEDFFSNPTRVIYTPIKEITIYVKEKDIKENDSR